MNLHNKDGSVSAYGFACGLVDTTHGCGTRLEKSHGAFLARADGGHSVLYHGPDMGEARKACRAYVRLAGRYWHGRYTVKSEGVGSDYHASVRLDGLVIGEGDTMHAAMLAAHAHESDARESAPCV